MLAAWLLTTVIEQTQIGISNILVYIDNQSVITKIPNATPGPAQHLSNTFHKIVEKTWNQGPRIKKFSIQWISAYSNITQNKQVDKEAKRAADSTLSEEEHLPPSTLEDTPTQKVGTGTGSKENLKDKMAR